MARALHESTVIVKRMLNAGIMRDKREQTLTLTLPDQKDPGR